MSARIIFMGTPDFAVPILKSLINSKYEVVLVVSQPDRPQGRHQELMPTPVKACALEHNIPVIQPEKVRTKDFETCIQEQAADYIITAAYGRILPKNILDIPKKYCLNVHGSLLPKYRGAAPVQWAVINGDKQSGISIIEMVEAMDAGAIFKQAFVDIDRMTAEELMEELSYLGAETIVSTLDEIEQNGITPIEQDVSQVTYVSMLKKSDGEIDWQQTAQQIDQRVRGTYPWPGAYTWLSGKRFKIHATRVLDIKAEHVPGTIYAKSGRLLVSCSDKTLELLVIQPEGSKKLAAESCAHNYKLAKQFGN